MPKAKEYPDGHDTVVAKEPCPKCLSKDNLVRYADGHAHCFSQGCGHWEPAEGEAANTKLRTPKPKVPDELLSPDPSGDPWADNGGRKVSGKTLQRVGSFKGTYGKDKKGVRVYPYYSQAGDLVIQKLRIPPKDFVVLKAENAPPLHECQLYMQHVWGDRFDRQVIITTGEEDAHAVVEVKDFKVAVVSIPAGDGAAKKCLQANWRWVDRFKDIVFLFDDDESGRAIIDECAELFEVGKVRIGRIHGYKDASDAKKANRPGDIEAAIYAATTWRPQGIVNAADCIADITENDAALPAWSYPFAGMQAITRGFRPGEAIYHVAGTGIGKTTLLREYGDHLLVSEEQPIPDTKIGVLSFEDMRRDVQLQMMSVRANKRLNIDPLPKEEMIKLHKDVFGSRRCELFDPETAEWSMDAILGYFRYMVKALECNVLFADPLSFIIAGLAAGDDERRALDHASMKIAKSAKELAVPIHITHHLRRTDGVAHEEGGVISINEVRGSAGVANFSSFVIGYERDQQGPRPDLTRIRILKNRPFGKTGVAGHLRFDDITGRYAETTDEIPDRKGGKGKGGFGRSDEGGGGFDAKDY